MKSYSNRLAYVQALGPFGIAVSGRPLRIPRAKEKALIAFLAVNAGRPFQREFLATLLWGNSAEDSAKHSLNNALYTIRRAAPSLLNIRSNVVCIADGIVETDLQELARRIEGSELLCNLDIIRGEFLADLDVRGAPEFESWRSSQNRTLFFNIEAAANAEFKTLDIAARAPVVLRLASIAAVCPSLDMTAFERIPVVGNPPATESQIMESTTSFVLPLVGREKQLGAMRRHWMLTRGGNTQLLTVTGHAGHGKTRLVEEFIRSIEGQDVRVLQTRCYRSECRIAFGPIVEMLSEAIRPIDLMGIEPIWLAALQELIPTLPCSLAAPPPLSSAASQSRLYEAVVRVIEAISSRAPLLIFVDDIQWSDTSTQALLSVLSHRLASPVMFVVAERRHTSPTHLHTPWRDWSTVEVGELSSKHLRDALQHLPKPIATVAPSVHELDRLTRGHPYMVTELIRSVIGVEEEFSIDNTLVGVDAFLGALLGELPQNAQRVASGLAVIGRPAPMSLITKVSRSPDTIVGLHVLLEKGLVDQARGKVALRHDLVRESIYKRLPLFTRNELHRRTAILLSAHPKYTGETAEHYYRARDRRNTYIYSLRAAKDADARYANDESIYFLRMAIKAAKRVHLRHVLRLAERLYRANRQTEARKEIRKLLARPHLLRLDEYVKWKLRELEIAYDTGEISGPALRAELTDMRQTIPDNEVGSLTRNLYLVTQSAFHDGERAAAAATQYTLKAIADRVESSDGTLALATAVHGHATVTSASEADAWAAPLRGRLESIQEPELLVMALTALTGVAYAAGRLPEASVYADRAIAEINRVGAMNLWPINAAHAQMLHVEQGRFTEAEVLYLEIKSRAAGFLDVMATASANSAMMYYTKREFIQARDVCEWGLTQLKNRKSTWTELVLRSLSGISALELGDMNTAAACAHNAQSQIDALGTRNVDLSYVEILIAKVSSLNGRKQAAMKRLQAAIDDYIDRDACCRMRMELEYARMMKAESREIARSLARKVYDAARAANAVIIAEGADGLLSRL
jgi:hypothetical protein